MYQCVYVCTRASVYVFVCNSAETVIYLKRKLNAPQYTFDIQSTLNAIYIVSVIVIITIPISKNI